MIDNKPLIISDMIYFIIFLLLLGLGLALFRFQLKKNTLSKHPSPPRPDGCCGLHPVCEHAGSRLSNTPCPADYYDDEELDRFRHRNNNDYSETETAEFGEVLRSLAEGETQQWLNSLRRRGITLPAALCNEAELISAGDKQKPASTLP